MAGPQLARDEAGNVWDVSNPGAPRFVSGASNMQVKPSPPAYRYEGPQAQATLQRTQQEVQQTAATMAANEARAKNEAAKSGIDLQAAKTDLGIKQGAPPGDASKYGEEYLATLPAGVGDLTRAMLGGKYKGSITTSRNPVVMQAALAAQHATHGQFDAGKYDERLALIKSMTDPNSSLGALNTALAHAGVLYDQAGNVAGTAALGHTPLSVGANAVSNWWNHSSPAVTTYEGTVSKYGPEQAKAYQIGTGGERQSIEGQYSENLPLDTKQALLRNDARLYSGKIASLAHGYDMLGANSPLDYLSPDAKEALRKIDPDTYNKIFGVTGGGNQPPPPGITPPPSGPGGNIGPSNNGVSDKPDPASAAFWEGAARQGMPYQAALEQWRNQVGSSGHVIVTPPDPEGYDKAVSYIKGHPNVEYHPFQSITQTPVSGVGAVTNAVAQSPSGAFAANYYDSLTGNSITRLAGDQGAYFRDVSSQQNPNASALGNVLGTVGGVSLLGRGIRAVSPALGAFGEIAGGTPTRSALTADNIFGAVSGSNQNPQNPFMGGLTGMAAMDAGHGFGHFVVAPGVAAALDTVPGQFLVNTGRKFVGMFGGMFGGGTPTPFSPPPAPDVQLSGATQKIIPGVVDKLNQAADLKLPYSLADADPRLRALLGSASRFNPDVRATAESVLGPRQLGQGERAISLIDNKLAPVGDVPTIMANARTNAQQASKPLYEKAFQAPTPMNDPQLTEMLNSPAGQQASRNAYNIALNNGENPAELSFATDPQGNPITIANPNWKTLQYVKRGLDKVIIDNQDQFGNLNLSDPANLALNDLRARFVSRLGDINPDYKAANAAYEAEISKGSAAQHGANATAINVTPEATQRALARVNGNLPYFQQGYASNMADTIGKQRMSGNPYDLVNGSMWQKQKLGMVFPNGANSFETAHGLEGDMGKTAQEVLGGSQTQPRAQADRMFTGGDAADVALDLMPMAMGAPPMGLLGTFARKSIDQARFGMGAEKAGKIGPMLLNTDPEANLRLIDTWSQQQAARQAYLNRVRAGSGQAGAGMFGAPLIYGLSQN